MAMLKTVIVFSFWMVLLSNVSVGCTKNVKPQTLSCKQIRQIVDAHNDCRAKVAAGAVRGQPAAADMMYMIWDVELADKASKHAAEGHFAHNTNMTIPSQRFTTGENLFASWTTAKVAVFNATEAVGSWFKEHAVFTYGKLAMETLAAVGHYTQIVWADTVYVGCGLSLKEEGRSKTFLFVCNYGPLGNIFGVEPYKKASSAGKLQCGTKNCDKKYGPKC